MKFAAAKTHAISWGMIHGVNDLVAGYMLANFSVHATQSEGLVILVLYGSIAFAGQLPLAFIIDKLKAMKRFALASLGLLYLSIAIYFLSPVAGIIITAFAGAGVHVCGGLITIQQESSKASLAGIFTAPGVLGLTIGGILGGYSWPLILAAGLLLALTLIISQLGIPEYKICIKKQKSTLDVHDWIMLFILLVMCMRSFIFDMVNFIAYEQPYGAFILAMSAFGGKFLGGFIADKFGWKKTAYAGLLLGLVFLNIGRDNIYTLAFGIACLQSSVPVTLMLLFSGLSQYPASSVALSLGTSVAVSGLPFYIISKQVINSEYSTINMIAILLLILIALFYMMTRPGNAIIAYRASS